MKLAGALLLLTIVAKIISRMTWDEMGKAAVGLAGLAAVVAVLILVTKLAGPHINDVGPTLWKIAGAMVVLTITAKMIARMTWGDMGKALVGLAGLS